MTYFPIAEYWWFYAGFAAFVAALLALDLGVFHRRPHAVGFREAALWSALWIALALAFNLGLYRYAAWQFARDPRLLALPGFDPEAAARGVGLEFLTGYLVEKSLSLDNIFVFVMIFAVLGIPAVYQHRVLFYGILGALAFRAVLIALGSALLSYQWMMTLFGVILIATAVKMAFLPERRVDPGRHFAVRALRRLLPVTAEPEGPRFFLRRAGVLHATPLAVALLLVELSDIVFAVDSVPAIFALTREPLIVFTSNIFAILGLRSLYFLLAGAAERFTFLKYGLALVLAFVGVKMAWLNRVFDGHFPTLWSLAIIGGVIAASILLSLAAARPARTA